MKRRPGGSAIFSSCTVRNVVGTQNCTAVVMSERETGKLGD